MPLFQVFTNALTTCSATFITWDRAYCVFARQTFGEKAVYLLRHPDIRQGGGLKCYKTVGSKVNLVTLDDQSTPETKASTTAPRNILLGERRVGDRQSWVMPLRTTEIKPSMLPSYLTDYAGFTVQISRSPPGAPQHPVHYTIKASLIKQHALKYEYVLPSATTENCRFEDRIILALHLLDPKHLPPNFTLSQLWVVNGRRSMVPNLTALALWSPPEDSDWEYYDDEMLELLKRRYLSLRAELEG